MKYVKSGELFSYIKPSGMSEEFVRPLVANLVEALDRVHKSGHAHMDIKLSNVLLDESKAPHFSDFGLAVKVGKDEMLDGNEYCWAGTRKYTAPEILQKKMFDPFKADIFSLGVCLFVMVVGSFPFKMATIEDRNYKRLYSRDPMHLWKKHSKVKKIIKLKQDSICKGENRSVPKFPVELSKLIVSMINPQPEKRPSIDEIRQNPWVNRLI
uniref:non-specific serine/threonine protein kinase n=1 Tax=Euplotes harpa TaxID=151035 RepID=A0A7S3J1K7_9SPIT|mmetsp:Transcript_14759/g.17078  ORF Transcript_14759/g.17078 Transcript_14759/m.17078 type:complete len:211 (+) Transcript_14759:324-956(+)